MSNSVEETKQKKAFDFLKHRCPFGCEVWEGNQMKVFIPIMCNEEFSMDTNWYSLAMRIIEDIKANEQ